MRSFAPLRMTTGRLEIRREFETSGGVKTSGELETRGALGLAAGGPA